YNLILTGLRLVRLLEMPYNHSHKDLDSLGCSRGNRFDEIRCDLILGFVPMSRDSEWKLHRR
ncbi:MAG: hypothetical protein ACFFCK_11915, partial [Promethearchaeota archaeon]